MERFINILLARRWVTLTLTAIFALAGWVAWTRLPIDAFPDVTNVQVMILTEAPGLSTVDVEQQITYPIEQQMGGVPKVIQVRSLSKAGLSQVIVVFEDNTDIYFARQQIFERLANAREHLPSFAEPELGPISTGLGEIFQYTLEGDGMDAMELRRLQDALISPQLRPIPGVNEVNSFGGYVRQYHVLVDQESLLKYGISLREVVEALEKNNANAAGGFIVRGWEQTYVRGLGQLTGPDDIGGIVLKSHDGTSVHIHDVANITIGPQARQGAVTRDGHGEAVAGMVIMLRGENSKDVVTRVKNAIPRIQKSLPKGAMINIFYDRTELIEACIKTVADALIEGGVLVILVLFLFLAELRTALIVVLTLPLTFLVTFLIMGRLDISSNLMSLGGLAFSVGMVVDAAIVIVENMRRHFAENPEKSMKNRIAAVAVAEVARPVAFSIMIIAIVMVPLFSLQGIEGKMFLPLASTMIIAILVSLVVALTAVPVLSTLILSQTPEKEFWFIRALNRGYMSLLSGARRHGVVTMTIATMSLAAAGWAISGIGTEFMPHLDEGAIAVNAVRLPNASLDGSVSVSSFVEKRLLASFPEVSTVISKTGRAEISEDPMGPEQTDFFIMLKPKKEWTSGRSKAELIEGMNRELSSIPGIRLSFSQPIALRVNELISGVKSDLAVKVYGEDLEKLKGYADRVAAILSGLEGARDVKVEQVSGMEQIEISYDRTMLARYGVNAGDVNEAIEIALAGREATRIVEGPMRTATVVRLAEKDRMDLDSLEKLLIRGALGEPIRLGQVAQITTVEGPAQIGRENGMRRVAAEVNIRGRDLGSFVADAQEKLDGIEKELPTGYFLEYGGQFENQQRAMRRLTIVVPAALFLIFCLLFMALGNLRDSLLVILNLPFALVGGILAIRAWNMPLSVSAAVAFICLLGIAVQNGVVLIAFFRQLRDKGQTIDDTIREGCRLRFRPLLMTALTSFIGHLPMLYATGSGADIQKPLAVVVMGGIITSTLLTLVVIPVLYGWQEKRFNSTQWDEMLVPNREETIPIP
ncbi:MAG: CusA/CzcA family heavy metal efflux RND transporter [Proteobacteria bacterium]|nr:efflux RND transporter permease subunit [Desulfobulbaceae bacterium]MBU4152490.1 CusA/CzcA family heavy metal efflux RND transporter [Pseudomonadota bacterium]